MVACTLTDKILKWLQRLIFCSRRNIFTAKSKRVFKKVDQAEQGSY